MVFTKGKRYRVIAEGASLIPRFPGSGYGRTTLRVGDIILCEGNLSNGAWNPPSLGFRLEGGSGLPGQHFIPGDGFFTPNAGYLAPVESS